MGAAEIISLICFLSIVAVTILLVVRDHYIKKQCEARVADIANKINEINKFKFYADRSQYDRLQDLETAVNSVQRNYVKKQDLANQVNTRMLVAQNVRADVADARSLNVEDTVMSKNFVTQDGSLPSSKTRQECVLVEDFEDQAANFEKVDMSEMITRKAKADTADINTAEVRNLVVSDGKADNISAKSAVLGDANINNVNISGGII